MNQTKATNQANGVRLELYQPKFKDKVLSFELPEEQKQFTGMPNDVLSIALEDPNRSPIVIVNESIPVGFFVLHVGPDIRDFTPNPDAILLRAYSINSLHQGKGFAKKSLQLLPQFVREFFPHINEIVLAVNARNEVAKQLYLKTGFQDQGIRREGRKGEQLILHYPLNLIN